VSVSGIECRRRRVLVRKNRSKEAKKCAMGDGRSVIRFHPEQDESSQDQGE
jgi:hypothetical protein